MLQEAEPHPLEGSPVFLRRNRTFNMQTFQFQADSNIDSREL